MPRIDLSERKRSKVLENVSEVSQDLKKIFLILLEKEVITQQDGKSFETLVSNLVTSNGDDSKVRLELISFLDDCFTRDPILARLQRVSKHYPLLVAVIPVLKGILS